MLILGIDPGYAIVGFGVLESAGGRQRLVRCGAINTPAGMALPARLLQIARDMETLIGQFHPQAMAIEELFFNHNVTTGIGVAQARGVILMTAEKLSVPVYEYNPSQVKQAGPDSLLRVHPSSGEAGSGGLRQGGEKAGDGDDSHHAGIGQSSATGRRGRRSGHRPVPRPLVHLATEGIPMIP